MTEDQKAYIAQLSPMEKKSVRNRNGSLGDLFQYREKHWISKLEEGKE